MSLSNKVDTMPILLAYNSRVGFDPCPSIGEITALATASVPVADEKVTSAKVYPDPSLVTVMFVISPSTTVAVAVAPEPSPVKTTVTAPEI